MKIVNGLNPLATITNVLKYFTSDILSVLNYFYFVFFYDNINLVKRIIAYTHIFNWIYASFKYNG